MAKFKSNTEPDKLEKAWERWKENGSQQARSQLFDMASPVIRMARNTYAGDIQGKQPDEASGIEGNPTIALKSRELAQKAFDTYDPDNRASLKRHLMVQMQPLKRVVHQVANPLKIPQRTWWDMQNLREEEDKYREKYDREPSAQEMADRTGLNLDRVAKLREIGKEPISDSALRKQDPKALQSLQARGTEPDDWPLRAVYYSLGETDRKIMEQRTGLWGADKRPNKDIAKELGISAGAVSQRSKKISDMLLEAMEMEGQ